MLLFVKTPYSIYTVYISDGRINEWFSIVKTWPSQPFVILLSNTRCHYATAEGSVSLQGGGQHKSQAVLYTLQELYSMTCWDFFLKKEMIVFSDPLEDISKMNYEIIN